MMRRERLIGLLAALLLAPVPMPSQEDGDDETLEQYEIEGARLGRKLAQQARMANLENLVTLVTVMADTSDEDTPAERRRPQSFAGAMDGVVVGTLAHSYGYQNYYHGPREFNYRKRYVGSTDISAVDVVNVTFADDDGDGALGCNETAQVYFDLINTGDEPLCGITPILMANRTKHVDVSAPCTIDTLRPRSALRYVAEIAGDGKRDAGHLVLLLRLKYGGQHYRDITEIVLGTKRRR